MELSKVLDAFKFTPRILFGLVLATGTAVFSPPALVAALGLEELLKQYRGWIGATFLVASALFVSSMLAKVAQYYWPLVREHMQVRVSRRALRHLSRPERELLAMYLRHDTTTLPFDLRDGCVQGLQAKGIVYRASNMGQMTSFHFNLQPWAWMYLSKHPEIVVDETELSDEKADGRRLSR